MLHACPAQAVAQSYHNTRGDHRPLVSAGIARPFARSQPWKRCKAKLVSRLFSSSVPCVSSPCLRRGPGSRGGFASATQLTVSLSKQRSFNLGTERRTRRGAVSIVSRIAARIKSAAPLPLIGRGRGARSLGDHTDPDAGIMDVPGHGPIVDALAGEFEHGLLKRDLDV
jgi:hypothetical protein